MGNVELMVVMIAAQLSGREGIEGRVGNHKLVVDVASTIVPKDGSAVTYKLATGGVTTASWTHEVDTWAAQV